MRKISRIYIHCSASQYGNLEIIDGWHKERGFEVVVGDKTYHIGYHYLILNQFEDADDVDVKPASMTDGQIVLGRPVEAVGAHVKGNNSHSIGVCYVGFTPTPMQLQSMLWLCKGLLKQFELSPEDVWGHHEYYSRNMRLIKKTCPNFNCDAFRNSLRLII